MTWCYINHEGILEVLLLGDLYGCANEPGTPSKLIPRGVLECVVIL